MASIVKCDSCNGSGYAPNGVHQCNACCGRGTIIDTTNTPSQQERIRQVGQAYVWIRKNNQSISDEILDLMKNAAIAAIESEVYDGK